MYLYQDNKEVFNVTDSVTGIWDKMAGWVDKLILNLPNFILAILVMIFFVFIAKLVVKFVRRLMRKSNASSSIIDISVSFVKIIIIAVGFFIALGVLDLNKVLTSVLAGAGVVGLAIGLALQGTLHNTFSGIILSFRSELEVGDWIESNDFAGEVQEVNLRNVVIKQSDNNLVIIPNIKIVENPFKNLSSTSRSRVILDCRVGYESDLEEVEKITLHVIENIFDQKENEKVEFAYTKFGKSSIKFVVRFWTDVSKQRDILFAKHKAILAIRKSFNENSIQIPFPIKTLDFGKNKLSSETIHINSKTDSDSSKEE
ncbi:mechanosensitive ion channel family protein [Mesonia sp. MT50]|uniref:Mechanosensitive ion channel family protein n=1 Tax=Mesonia profundi TaxID=3070998 RepID=A0ABU1A3C6_9FLAO|nr:mechanosensitive ion channel family protein [Mesonia profundi]MDQ7918210.1 mechanosensitive ion channel family protein [Mesonia profundi]